MKLFFTGIVLTFIISFLGYTGDREGFDWEKVDSVFAKWDTPDSPGCALGVYDRGEIVYAEGYGIANLDHGVPISPETVFYIGSVSKQFAAAAIAILADRGDIDLDDDIRKYIPEMPEYQESIRIRHLVYHTSGIRDLYALMNFAEVNVANVLSIQEKLDLISSQSDLNFKPGDEYLYSNSGYTLIGILVDRVTGKSLREFTDQNIFQPLGMENTHFHDNRHEIVNNRALSYQQDDNGKFYQSYLVNFEGVGPGGLYTTIDDLFKWDQNLYENRLTHAPNLNEIMHTRGILNDGDTLHYAFALQFGDHKGIKTVGHGGSFMGFRADYLRFPEQQFSIGILCNLGNINPRSLSTQIADLYLADVIRENLREYEGEYKNAELGATYTIRLEGSDLKLERSMSPKGKLLYEEKDIFSIGGWKIEFIRDQDDRVDGFKVDSGRARNVIFHLVETL